MDHTKNLVDVFVNTQKDMMDAWKNYVGKIEAPKMPNGEWQSLYENWYNEQKQILEESGKIVNPKEMMENWPDQYQKMIEIQTNYAKKWGELYQSSFNTSQPTENMEGWMKLMKTQYDLLQQMSSNMQEAFRQQFGSMIPFNNLSSMEGIANAYSEMAKYWENILKSIQGGKPFEFADMHQWMSPQSYQDFLEKLMNINIPDMMKESAERTQQMFSNYTEWLTNQTSGFTQNFMGQPDMPYPFGMDAWFKFAQEMQNKLESSFAPMLHLTDQGKMSEMANLAREAQKEYMNYMVKGTEVQVKFLEAGQSALPETIDTMQTKFKETQKLPTYEEFFTAFINTLENHLIKVFETESYSGLQNDLAAASVKVKNRVERYLELAMEGAPFALRSETSEIVKEIQELRRKVRKLEKMVEETPENDPAPKTKGRKKTTSTEA